MLALCAALGAGSSPAEESSTPAPRATPAEAEIGPGTAGLSAEDRELLKLLDLLEELELLDAWDPQEDLPIPSSSVLSPEPESAP